MPAGLRTSRVGAPLDLAGSPADAHSGPAPLGAARTGGSPHFRRRQDVLIGPGTGARPAHAAGARGRRLFSGAPRTRRPSGAGVKAGELQERRPRNGRSRAP